MPDNSKFLPNGTARRIERSSKRFMKEYFEYLEELKLLGKFAGKRYANRQLNFESWAIQKFGAMSALLEEMMVRLEALEAR
jgi:hypothetical protein